MGHNSVVSGHPKSTRIPLVDGLSTGPPDLGCHSMCHHAMCHQVMCHPTPLPRKTKKNPSLWNLTISPRQLGFTRRTLRCRPFRHPRVRFYPGFTKKYY